MRPEVALLAFNAAFLHHWLKLPSSHSGTQALDATWRASGCGSPQLAPPAATCAVAGPSEASRATQGHGGPGPGERGLGLLMHCPAVGSQCLAGGSSSHKSDLTGAPRRPGCQGARPGPAACTRPAQSLPAAAMLDPPSPLIPAPVHGELWEGRGEVRPGWV